MTQAELIAALPAGRLPPDLMQAHAADFLLLFGAGLLLVALLSGLAMPFLERKPSRRARIRATRGLPPQERSLAIAHILGYLPEALRATAYGAAAPLDAAAIEKVALAARRARR
ncbi:hypothetical protein [Ancylobacter oerskovii]|uniref:Uncharacterized protein n=1 Tax=Ancylobacter oerskovii TaxID=459519 RepID=A0ABW4YWL2_9HYPH|nr:hypothetical protein [Ancylobacter oerskovii]MBS7544126.1 hypothetical protein [Ancylobacter oerskovii]